MSRKRDLRAMIVVLVVMLVGMLFSSRQTANAMVSEQTEIPEARDDQ